LFDASTGKHYFNARYYNGISEATSYQMPPRFLSPDILKGGVEDGQSWNRYGYALNIPVAYIDPDGLSTVRIYTNSGDNSTPETLVDPTIDEFRKTIIAQAAGSIKRLEISGHGGPDNITIEPGGSGHGLASGNEVSGVVFTDTGEKFAAFVKGKLADGATIDLIGCNTANNRPWMKIGDKVFGSDNPIARQLSSELPGITVVGSRGFGLGNEVGNPLNRDQYFRIGKENHAFRLPRSYQNGQEILLTFSFYFWK
jgi:RHS repeat-associated protein